jgi:hypothetical protein
MSLFLQQLQNFGARIKVAMGMFQGNICPLPGINKRMILKAKNKLIHLCLM